MSLMWICVLTPPGLMLGARGLQLLEKVLVEQDDRIFRSSSAPSQHLGFRQGE
jgi:hypothetical protein